MVSPFCVRYAFVLTDDRWKAASRHKIAGNLFAPTMDFIISVWGIYQSLVFVVFIYYCKLTELSAVKLEIPYPASLRMISTMRTAFFSPTVASAVSVSMLVCPPPNKL